MTGFEAIYTDQPLEKMNLKKDRSKRYSWKFNESLYLDKDEIWGEMKETEGIFENMHRYYVGWNSGMKSIFQFVKEYLTIGKEIFLVTLWFDENHPLNDFNKVTIDLSKVALKNSSDDVLYDGKRFDLRVFTIYEFIGCLL